MTTEEIIKRNKVIAEFMEFKEEIKSHYYVKNKHTVDLLPLFAFEFHSSWDWLMPVVVKINTIDHFEYSIKINTMDCEVRDSKGKLIVECSNKYNPDELQMSVFELVSDFCEWYNKIKLYGI